MHTLTTKQTLSMFIFTSLILFPSIVTANCDYGTCEYQSQRFQRVRILTEPNEMEITPGVTKELQIQLKGQTEQIAVRFKAEELDLTNFLVSIANNKELTSTINANFPDRETLKVTLNYETKQSNVIGSNGFSLSLPIKDDAYEITVDKSDASGVIIEDGYDLIKVTSHENLNSSFGAVVTVGCCVLAMLALRMFLAAKKGKNLLVEELDETSNGQEASKRTDNEAVMYSKVGLKNQDAKSVEDKNNTSLMKDLNVVLDNGKLNTSKDSKKTDAYTIVSTTQTLSGLPLQRPIRVGSFAKINSIHDDSGHHQHHEHHGSIIIESPALTPNGTAKPFFPHKHHQDIGMDLALSMDMFGTDGNKVPTITAIKDLVNQMKRDGTIGCQDDPSVDSDSDDEDQYEAPQLPNYTCCMLCFQGTRCTIVEPCRHVFACVECADELLDSYKICVLCANPISEYGMLADEQ